jgi:1-acyl-sn-glycerol-3-phosphate acyltransferase
MFPEGTRSRSGQLQRGRSGAAYVAIRAQVPVVPAVVINSEAIVRRSNWLDFKSRPLVTVRVGEPLWPPQDPEDRRGLRVFTREIMQATAALLPDQLVQEVEEL